MPNVKLPNGDVLSERSSVDATGAAPFESTNPPVQKQFPTIPRMAKLMRKLKAYERVWNEVCAAHERDDRETARSKLKALPDAVDFLMFLLEYCAEPTNTSKAGGEARNANVAPMRNHARRVYQEEKQKRIAEGKTYSHTHFAKDHRLKLESHYSATVAVSNEAQARIQAIDEKLSRDEPSAAERKELNAARRDLKKIVRSKPRLPSLKTISAWLNGL